jgi:hypothetical protein
MNPSMRRFEKECRRVELAHYLDERAREARATGGHSKTTVWAFLAEALRRCRELIYALYRRGF